MKNRLAQLAVDIGGTFTDVVLMDTEQLYTRKILTTHEDPVAGVLEGIDQVMAEGNLEPAKITTIIHGTTLAANAVIERRGAITALLVTAGHRDTIETGYESRFDQYDLSLVKPSPLVPRYLRWPVKERLSATGGVLVPLDDSSVRKLFYKIREYRVESIAVGFLHAYKNPNHEKRTAEILKDEFPDVRITLSSRVSPVIREYDRLSTTTANAYIQPLIAGYLQNLERRLIDKGFNCPLLLVMSSGGLTTVDTATEFPVRLVESGPAGGAILAATIAAKSGYSEVVSVDMGGTTAKLCLIENGVPKRADVFEIDHTCRFVRGSGIPVRIPTIALVEIGAGGGSIAHIDELGRLRTGPQSAGSRPGPSCYGLGGEHATVTDADLVLGRIDSGAFAGGMLKLQPERAVEAISGNIGGPLSLDSQSAAAGICEVVDETMANAARVHAIESGKDITNYTLIAFGGAAPLHAARIAEKLGIERIVIPANAGVGSAVGFLLAPISFEVTHSWIINIDHIRDADLTSLLTSMREEATAIVRQAVTEKDLTVQITANMRYTGQSHEVDVKLDNENCLDKRALRKAFEKRYQQLYARLIPDVPVELVTIAVTASAKSQLFFTESKQSVAKPPVASKTRRAIIDREKTGVEIPVYERSALQSGNRITGPALISEIQTTTVVPGHTEVTVDARGNLELNRDIFR